MANDLKLLQTILVNYSFFGEPDGVDTPQHERIGTLIHDVDDVAYIKVSDTHCRLATAAELKGWSGPVSPWHKAGLYR
jgi:hypothetical protein